MTIYHATPKLQARKKETGRGRNLDAYQSPLSLTCIRHFKLYHNWDPRRRNSRLYTYDRTFENQNGRSFLSASGVASPLSMYTESYSRKSSRFHRPSGRERRSRIIWNEYRVSVLAGSRRSSMCTVVPSRYQVPMKNPWPLPVMRELGKWQGHLPSYARRA